MVFWNGLSLGKIRLHKRTTKSDRVKALYSY